MASTPADRPVSISRQVNVMTDWTTVRFFRRGSWTGKARARKSHAMTILFAAADVWENDFWASKTALISSYRSDVPIPSTSMAAILVAISK